MTWTDQLLMTEKPTLCLNREWTSLRFLILVLLTVKHSQKFVECQESTCSSNAPTLCLADETTENMAGAKCWLQCVDYIIVVEAILTGQSHLHFCCKFFLWRLKILKRQGVSFFWKSIEKYEINSLSISSKRWQGTESQLPASLNIENLITNKQFLDASVTSWSQFRTLQWGVCCRFVSHFWNCLSPGRCGKDVVTF